MNRIVRGYGISGVYTSCNNSADLDSPLAVTCVAGSGYMPRGCSLKLAMPVQIVKLVFNLISYFLLICEVIHNKIC